MSNGLFDNVDDEDDQLFKDLEPKPNSRETTPEYFSEVKPSDEMNLFSPSNKPKNSLFDYDDDHNATEESKQEDNDLIDDDEPVPKNDNISEEPLGFLRDEENNEADDEYREEFELIDSTEVPSVEEAERQLEIARQESERIKREQEEEQRREEEGEGEESQDGGAFSRVFGGDAAPDSSTSVEVPIVHEVKEKDTSNENNDELVEELQQEISQLTSSLRSAQAENGSLNSEVSELRIQLTEERDRNDRLQEELKKKDAEIASLKESSAASSGKPPKPTTRKPSVPSATKVSAVTSPRSARLKQETDKKSVAETAKRFNQPDKKTSPSLRRATKKDSVDKSESRIPRQDSATRKSAADSPSASDKKSSSPPKPVRSKTRTDSKSEDSPMISHKPQRNTLDAIKLWEQKSGDKKETSPAAVKKPLSTATSAPNVGDDVVSENGEENHPPSTTDEVVDTKDDTVTEKQQKSPSRLSTGNSAFARQRKTESMIVSGSKSSRWVAPTVDKCQVCKKTVYPMERLLADEKMYHKTCFRCSHCKKVVGLGTYAANKGEIFCKTHFKMLFKIKGNYDEGFGREQHKRRWTKGGAPDQEAAD